MPKLKTERKDRAHKGRLTFLPKGLKLTDDQFQDLWYVIDKSRPSSATVNVNKPAFMNLMMDYGVILAGYDELERVLRSPSPDNNPARSADESEDNPARSADESEDNGEDLI